MQWFRATPSLFADAPQTQQQWQQQWQQQHSQGAAGGSHGHTGGHHGYHSQPPVPPNYATPAKVGELISCGFSSDTARTALQRAHGNMNAALEECLKIQAELEAEVAELVDMGFSREAAQIALDECNGSLPDATEWLLTHPDCGFPPVEAFPAFKHEESLEAASLDAGDVPLPAGEPRVEYDAMMKQRFVRVPISKFSSTMLRSVMVLKRRARAVQLRRHKTRSSVAAARPPEAAPTAPALVRQPTREDAIVDGKQRIEERLASLALETVVMADDGNCQFRALSHELYGTQQYHHAIRLRTVEFMSQEENKDDFAPYFADEDFEPYLQKMTRLGTWGDELSLRASADVLQVEIYVVSSESENWLLHYVPDHCEPIRALFLEYVSPIHYNAVQPKAQSDNNQGRAVLNSAMRRQASAEEADAAAAARAAEC